MEVTVVACRALTDARTVTAVAFSALSDAVEETVAAGRGVCIDHAAVSVIRVATSNSLTGVATSDFLIRADANGWGPAAGLHFGRAAASARVPHRLTLPGEHAERGSP